MRWALVVLLLAGCAAVPPGTVSVVNPNCVWRCYVAPTSISQNPSLDTLTFDDGDVANTESRSRSIGGP